MTGLKGSCSIDYYPHQIEAIETTIANKFRSGLYCHATGTGKTVTALGIIEAFIQRDRNTSGSGKELLRDDNIIWFCERRDVLTHMKLFIKRKFPNLLKTFFITEYVQNKSSDWCERLSQLRVWGRPLLIFINRAFLTSRDRYEKLSSGRTSIPIKLVIHDESHSGGADSTYAFLKFIQDRGAKILGFSATPLKWQSQAAMRIREIYPQIISSFHFREAITAGVIVPPKLIWYNDGHSVSYSVNHSVSNSVTESIDPISTYEPIDRYSILNWMPILNNLWASLPYRKTVVWTGTIASCQEMAILFKTHQGKYPQLAKLSITVDISEALKPEVACWSRSFDDYYRQESDGILFCAMKHREGSDIPNLDSCLFLDGVTDRTDTSFIQSIGRVLRKDLKGKKEFGLVIDTSANDFTYYYNYLNRYLLDTERAKAQEGERSHKDEEIFDDSKFNPEGDLLIEGLNGFEHEFEEFMVNVNGVNCSIHSCVLDFQRTRKEAVQDNLDRLKNSGVEELKAHFVRSLPKARFRTKSGKVVIKESRLYQNRLEFELDLIKSNGYIYYLLQVVEILKIIGNLPKIIRGSCGSSLVCYLLGITNIDPIKYQIQFVRFLNNSRKTMPDIDIDFPYYLRNQVFQAIERHWPGRVARISNHLYFRDRSSLRETIRLLGYRKQIRNDDLYTFLKNLSEEETAQLQEHINSLESTFRGYSLHCGGIVVFEDGVPPELLLRSRCGNQIIYDKRDVQEHNHFKIDILSNRGLATLMTVYPNRAIESYQVSESVYQLLASGNNIGLTFAESRAMRRALMTVKPKSVIDVAFCLAIIRPAFSEGLKELDNEGTIIHGNRVYESKSDKTSNQAIKSSDMPPAFDDDIIGLVSEWCQCPEDEADLIRRAFAKGDQTLIDEFTEKYKDNPKYDELVSLLQRLRRYGFCKSHAISYAQLVVGLAHAKLYRPKEFWLALLNHSQSSFRKWVYWREAAKAGWKLTLGQKPYYGKDNEIVTNRKDVSFPTKLSSVETFLSQLKKFGYWNAPYFIPGMYFYPNPNKTRAQFRGLIANGRTIRRKRQLTTFLTIGYEDGSYLDLVLRRSTSTNLSYSRYNICEGEGLLHGDKTGFFYLEPSSIRFS